MAICFLQFIQRLHSNIEALVPKSTYVLQLITAVRNGNGELFMVHATLMSVTQSATIPYVCYFAWPTAILLLMMILIIFAKVWYRKPIEIPCIPYNHVQLQYWLCFLLKGSVSTPSLEPHFASCFSTDNMPSRFLKLLK